MHALSESRPALNPLALAKHFETLERMLSHDSRIAKETAPCTTRTAMTRRTWKQNPRRITDALRWVSATTT